MNLDLWDKSARWWDRTRRFGPEGVQGLVEFVRNHRYALVGDVMLIEFATGDDRFSCTGITSKGRRLLDYWVTVDRTVHPYTRIVELPPELQDCPATGAALRRFVGGIYAQRVAALH